MNYKVNIYDMDCAWGSFPPENMTERHILIVVVVDTSGSMYPQQEELNKALQNLVEGLKKDPTTRGAAEICIIGVGGDAPTVLLPFKPLRMAQAPQIICGGGTPMYAGVELGLKLLEQRRAEFKQYNPPVPMYKPFVFVLTDGAANDRPTGSFKRLRELQKPTRPGSKCGKLFVYPIGLGQEFEKEENRLTLASMSLNREIYTGDYDKLSAFFQFVATTTTSTLQLVEGSAIELPDPEKLGFKREQFGFDEMVDED